MYGTEGKIGLLVPSNNTVIEPEFCRLMPAGMTAYAARMTLTQADREHAIQMCEEAEGAARQLATAEVDVVAFGATAASLLGGITWERDLRERIHSACQIPVVTTAQAVVEALREMGLTRIVVATPYPEEFDRLEKEFLEENGFEVLEMRGLGIVKAVDIGKRLPEEALALALELPYEDADGVFISCTNFRTLDIIEEAEKEMGRPVITSNQATFWLCLRTMGRSANVDGYGTLLRETRSPMESLGG